MKFTERERNRALQVIAQCEGSLTIAASRLGISIATLSRWKKAATTTRVEEPNPGSRTLADPSPIVWNR